MRSEYYSSEQLIVHELFNPFKACQIRAKVYANACIYILLKKQTPDVISKIKQITQQFVESIEAADEKQKQFKFQLGQYTLVQELQHLLEKFQAITHLSLNDILLGEAFWHWQEFERSFLVSHCKVQIHENHFIELLQKDSPLEYPLSSTQLSEWQKRLEVNKPVWFMSLPTWAKMSLLDAGVDLNRIMSILFRGLPGIANSTKHEFQINSSELTQSFRVAVPVPYLMKDERERLNSTIGNIEQVLNYWLREEHLSHVMKQYWGYAQDGLLVKSIQKPLLVLSLLTGKNQATTLGKILDYLGLSINNNNSLLVYESNQCYLSFFNQHSEYRKKHTIYIQDLGINFFRSSKPVHFNEDFLIFLEDFFQNIQQNQNEIPKDNWVKVSALQEILITIKAQKEIKDSYWTQGRNKNLYLVALYDLAIRLTGGVSIGNCKSSKDRKGIALLYADAMLVFYHAYGVFPVYADQGIERQNFLNICKTLFDSGHILKVINQNLVGCTGLKDEGILDKDLIDALGDNYKMTKLIANLSEPVTFLEKYRLVIFKALIVVVVLELSVLGLSWFCQWLQPIDLPFVFFNSPLLTSFLTLIIMNIMVGVMFFILFEYANFKQKGESLDEIIMASENNAQSYDFYQKLACNS